MAVGSQAWRIQNISLPIGHHPVVVGPEKRDGNLGSMEEPASEGRWQCSHESMKLACRSDSTAS